MSERQEVRSEKNLRKALTIVGLILLSLTLLIAELNVTQPVTNTTGVVVAKKLVSPGEVDSPYALVVSRSDEAWVFRVNRLLWEETERLDRLYLTDHKGFISGLTHQTTLTANGVKQ